MPVAQNDKAKGLRAINLEFCAVRVPDCGLCAPRQVQSGGKPPHSKATESLKIETLRYKISIHI